MIGALDVIDRLPLELQARLEADPFFVDIPVIVAEEGDVAATLAQKQAVQTEKGGRRGVAVIVLQLVADDEYSEVSFGPMTLRPSFQVVELLELNRDPRGTGKSARRVARKIRDLIKPLALEGIATEFRPDKPCIEPVDLGKDMGALVRAYQVNFVTYEFDDESVVQVSRPEFADAGAPTPQLQLTSATAGAAIWYSLDESFPRPDAAGSALYANPIEIPEAGFTIRAAAYKDGLVASQVNRRHVTIQFP